VRSATCAWVSIGPIVFAYSPEAHVIICLQSLE
jgi:hypothetical protein